MTYGWMLIVVSIAGGAVFSVVGQEELETVSGFNNNDVRVSDFSLTGKNELQILLDKTAPEPIKIESIKFQSNNESILINGGPTLLDRNQKVIKTDLLRPDGYSDNIDIEITYSTGVLQDLIVSGSLRGSLEIEESYEMDYWWNESWSSGVPIYIDYDGDQDLNNYQVKVELDTQELISDSKLKDNCGDLRFTSFKNDLEYDYWIEEGCNTSSTNIRVEIPEINSSEDKKFYAYFDNPEASSESSGNSTMFIYDLHGNSYDGSLREDASYNSTQEFVELTDTLCCKQGHLIYNKVPKPGFKAEYDYYTGDGSGADAVFLAAYATEEDLGSEGSDKDDYKYSLDEYSGNNLQIGFNGDQNKRKTDPGFNIDDSTWRNVSVSFDGYNDHLFEVNGVSYIDTEISESKEDSGQYFGWGARTGGKNNHHRIRNLTVRKYVEPSPETSTGDIQKR